MLCVVQTAAWDWEPPHMCGCPHPPPPATTIPAASCPPSTLAIVQPRPAVAPRGTLGPIHRCPPPPPPPPPPHVGSHPGITAGIPPKGEPLPLDPPSTKVCPI